VTRNRIKRRLRHAARELHLTPGTDYVIIAKREAAQVAYAQLVGCLASAVEERENG
jgi:ribonuclease P protein component